MAAIDDLIAQVEDKTVRARFESILNQHAQDNSRAPFLSKFRSTGKG